MQLCSASFQLQNPKHRMWTHRDVLDMIFSSPLRSVLDTIQTWFLASSGGGVGYLSATSIWADGFRFQRVTEHDDFVRSSQS